VALEVPADWLIFGASAAAGLQPEEAELLSALRKVVARNAKEHDQQWQENVLDGFKAEARRAALEKARRRESGE
jgi:hypothetical protein